MPPLQPKTIMVNQVDEERITIEPVPAGTLMRVFRQVQIDTIRDVKTNVETTTERILSERQEVLWGKTKQDIVAELDTQKATIEAEKTAEVAKIEALQVELAK